MAAACEDDSIRAGESVTLAVRSENIRIQEECSCGLQAKVEEKSFAAGQLRVVLRLADGSRAGSQPLWNRCKSGTGTDSKCLLRTRRMLFLWTDPGRKRMSRTKIKKHSSSVWMVRSSVLFYTCVCGWTTYLYGSLKLCTAGKWFCSRVEPDSGKL